ncbi:hypothetical protein OAN307_c04200 [Octadecabacter antarcticus 307]|uniref:Uncharacterized protein n=2 Tax=Octadecabacter TaxID=53945 RepID=M9R749_9RHOB|nr:hypothetical protein OAN307_c04200 [Octadecabacter antarcticus 307]
MTLTFPTSNLSNLKWSFGAARTKSATEVISERDDALAERAFLRELMAHNPEAIQSDLGLMAMMTQYPPVILSVRNGSGFLTNGLFTN